MDNIIRHISNTFNDTVKLNDRFVGTPPYPMIVLDNFLPNDTALQLEKEADVIPEKHWTEFTRKGGYMQECNDMSAAPEAQELVNQIHSQQGMNWLSNITGIKDLIPDPYLVGAAYSKSYRGDNLGIHTDFNWNDEIKVHRMLSMIVYLNSDWKPEYGGDLQFKDFDNKKTIQSVAPLFNRAVIWRYHKRGFHGYPEPLACPEGMSRKTFRIFFYVSDAEYKEDDRPHRSLYWYDNDNQEPYDIVTQK